jgi:hypothetical protein
VRFGARRRARLKVRRSGGGFDASTYGRAVLLVFRTPSLMLGPLAVSLATLVITFGTASTGFFGDAQGWVSSLLLQVLRALGLGLSIAIADSAWSSPRDPFSYGLDRWNKRIGDIAIAGLGFGFIIWAAGQVGSVFGGYVSLALEAVAIFFFIFTIPAATIGGVPGGAALQIAFERSRSNRWNAALAGIIYVVVYLLAQTIAVLVLAPIFVAVPLPRPDLIFAVAQLLAQTLAGAYLAAVLAKSYNDASYGRFF